MTPIFLAALILMLVAFLVAALYRRPGRTAPIVDARGRPMPGSIAAIETMVIGGVAQTVLIRGHDVTNPVLLFLHGGPGTSEMPLLRVFNLPALERRFTVVVWDQRGAGKSFAAIEPLHAMNVGQFVSDARELVEALCARFRTGRIYLAGHSWGSILGVLTARECPERIAAYVGIGQVANMLQGERRSWRWTLDRAREAGDARAVARLLRMGEPPYAGDMRAHVVAQRAILARYGGEVHGDRRGAMPFVIRGLLAAKEYGWRDRVNFFRGIFATMRVMWPQILAIDLERQVPELAVPVYFLLGRHDMEAPSDLAARYFDALRAPRKMLVWFERSAHLPNVEEPDAFNRFFTERLLRETQGNS